MANHIMEEIDVAYTEVKQILHDIVDRSSNMNAAIKEKLSREININMLTVIRQKLFLSLTGSGAKLLESEQKTLTRQSFPVSERPLL